ncbi:MAG: hypothetical protein JXR96_29970 [Deltaproteobacteria bacterium]|nr:hypothetical protein [Deltaproteobacteria bacterium]
MSHDLDGSYLLGEADGDIWARHGHPNDTQSVSLLGPEEIGQRDVFGQETAPWLRDKAEQYDQTDPRFDELAYYEGFIAAVRRFRQVVSFTAAPAYRR